MVQGLDGIPSPDGSQGGTAVVEVLTCPEPLPAPSEGSSRKPFTVTGTSEHPVEVRFMVVEPACARDYALASCTGTFDASLAVIAGTTAAAGYAVVQVQLKVILHDGRVAAFRGTMVAIAREPVAVTNSDLTIATDTRRVPDAYAIAKLFGPDKMTGASLFFLRGG